MHRPVNAVWESLVLREGIKPQLIPYTWSLSRIVNLPDEAVQRLKLVEDGSRIESELFDQYGRILETAEYTEEAGWIITYTVWE